MTVRVAVCRKCKGHDRLVDFLRRETDAHVDMVRCQKICEGPVAGLEIDGRMEWFERVRTKKAMVGLQRVINGEPKLAPSLEKRQQKKRSGHER